MRIYGITLLLLGLAACGGQTEAPASSEATGAADTIRVDSSEQTRVEQAIENLNAMRSGLAQTIGDEPVDQQTFAQVCKPVGQRARELAAENGWTVQQVAERYRNPAHQLDEEARRIFERFENHPDLTRLWIDTEREGQPGSRYFRRITVEPACLACHGAEANRPDFVKENYPQDTAFGFEEGDLRGLYAVFVPVRSGDGG